MRQWVLGTINSSGAIDIAGLVKGPVISREIIVRETGSITGSTEGDHVKFMATWTVKFQATM